MDRVAYNALLAQYATPEVSGNGRVSWDKGVRCVMPEVKLFGKCEQETLTGKNLFDNQKAIDTATGEAQSKTYFRFDNGKTYTISFIPKIKKNYIWFAVSATSWNEPFDGKRLYFEYADYIYWTFTIPDDGIDYHLYVCSGGMPNANQYLEFFNGTNCENIQIELGSTATAYEPYCGGIPAPNPYYPMPVKCNNGKIICHGNTVLSNSNLFSGDFEWIQNTEKLWGLSESYKYTILHLKANTQYTIITPFGVYGKSKGFSSIYKSLNKNPVYHIYIQNAPSLCNQVTTLSTDDSGDVYLTYYGTSDPSAECVYREAYVVEGLCGQATAPELWGAPAGKWDPEGRPEVHDEWNPQTGYGLRRIKKIVFYGTENFSLNAQILQLSGKNAYQCSGNFGFKQSSQNGICSHFEIWSSTGFFRKNTVLVLGSNVIAFMTDGVQTIDEFKTWLAEQAAAGTPVTLWTYVAEPEPFYTEPQKLTQPPGSGQIIQLSGDVADCPITARYLTHS